MTNQSPYPALIATGGEIWVAPPGGAEPRRLTRAQAARQVVQSPHIFLHAPLVAHRLGATEISGLDILELFAFVRPTHFITPTSAGLAGALALPAPKSPPQEAAFLHQATQALLDELTRPDWAFRAGAQAALTGLVRLRWAWSSLIGPRLPPAQAPEAALFETLPKWGDVPPRAQPRDVTLTPAEVDQRLDALLGTGAERRAGQRDYAHAVAHAFAPRHNPDAPNAILAEAGAGTGKTLGYLAPASLWAEKAGGSVWIATYTRALQRQLRHESARLEAIWPPDDAHPDKRIVVRKGRENYLCLLNLEDALGGTFTGRAGIFAHLVARWARHTQDGDMLGGDFPGWLRSLFPRMAALSLTDRRGECIHAGCPHYRRCFIEHSVRAASRADLVIANHSLVMVNAAMGRAEGKSLHRIIFDEGHHLFQAADTTFSLHLTGAEAIELRRWILGPDTKGKGRRRGLRARLGDAIAADDKLQDALAQVENHARILPSEGWLTRLQDQMPEGVLEIFFGHLRHHVHARAHDKGGKSGGADYGLESEILNLEADLCMAAQGAEHGLTLLAQSISQLVTRLSALVEGGSDQIAPESRNRLENTRAGLERRRDMVQAWGVLLQRVQGDEDPDFVDWFAIDRFEGSERGLGVHRHWRDPTRPLAQTVLTPAHGLVITSATLRARIESHSETPPYARDARDARDERGENGQNATNDQDTTDEEGAHTSPDANDTNDGWTGAAVRTGVARLAEPAQSFATPSPFDYASRVQILIVTDVRRGHVADLAHAYAQLIRASNGGLLGLFSAIARLRAVHARIAGPLALQGLPLLAQHVDPMDTGALVDIFRADDKTSLLGTDALRDGVDVPGQSLRTVVMEGAPWPRPTILHAARRKAFGGRTYDDLMTRGRLAQAFGRLVRRATDRGHFILLGAAMPSRLLSAFPAQTPVLRLTLAQAAHLIADEEQKRAEDQPT